MAISVNHLKVGTDLGVPVGFGPGAAGVDDAVTTVVEAWGSLPGALLLPPMRARSWAMMAITRSVEPEPAGVPVYKVQSGKHSLLETPAHTHRIPALRHAALTLLDRSLSNRRSIRHGCKQSQKSRRHVVWK